MKIGSVFCNPNKYEIILYVSRLYDQVDNKNQNTHTYIHEIFSMSKPYNIEEE